MKRTTQYLIKTMIILSFLLSPIFSMPVQAQTVNNLIVAGSVTATGTPDYSGVIGTYTSAGTHNGHNLWSHTSGGSTYYIYYNSTYNDWEIFTALDSEDFLFYSSIASAPTPLDASWTSNTNHYSVASITVTEESATPVPEIDIKGNGSSITDGNTYPSFGNYTKFVSTDVSAGANTRTYTIYNIGTGSLTISGVSITGTNAADFSFSTVPASTVAASSSTTFTVNFNPATVGTKTATINVMSNDSSEGSYDFSIEGYGYTPENLAVTGITTPSAANTTYIHQGVLNNYEFWLSSNGYYLYTDGSNWLIDNNTDPSTSDKVDFFALSSFTPSILDASTWTGERGTGTPVIAAVSPTPNINVKGKGQTIVINDNSPSFTDDTKYGSVNIASGSRSRTYTIENMGGAALTISGVNISGIDAADFSVTTPPSASVASTGSTTFTVTFDPTTEGIKTATVSITSNDPDENPYPFSISGDAFSQKNLLVIGITGTYSDANGTYIYQGILNEYPYWKHASLNYYIYNDIYYGSYYWDIDIDTDDAASLFYSASNGENASPVNVPGWTALDGEGTPTIVYSGPEMDVKGNGNSITDGSAAPTTTNSTDFGSVSVASGTISRTFTIYNTGYEDLNLSGSPKVAISGTNSGDFTVTAQPITPVSALIGTTTFTIEFNPSGGGPRTATVSITNDDNNENPYDYSIQGTGITVPTVTTSAAIAIATTSATLGGNVTSDGGAAVTARGVVYSTTDNTPTTGESGVTQDTNGSGTGSFIETIGPMSIAAHYYFQAYAVNSQGTSYGGVEEFTTQNTITSIAVSDPNPSNASSVSWDVVFAASVTGLTSSNFTLANTGLTTPSITGVSGSGTAWTVTANTGTGSGTLGVNLTSDTGLNANLSNLPFTGEVYSIDRTPPDTSISAYPSNPTSSTSPSFTFTGDDGSGVGGLTFECDLDGGGFSSCSSPKSYTSLSDGSHTFQVRAFDSLGNVDATPASYTWVVDTTSPDTSITGYPSNPVNSTSATFNFSGNDAGGSGVSKFECDLDGAGFSTCSTGKEYTSLVDGSHTFQVRSVDNVGLNDPTPASYTWVVDTVNPTTDITGNPSNPTTSTGATFSFTGADTGGSGVSGFECNLDGAGFSACSTGQNYSGLSNGSHTFQVRGVDYAGNKDTTPASYTWVVDTTAPDTVIDTTPASLTNSTSATFTFHGNDGSGTGVAGFECDMGSGYSTCTTPKGFTNLSEGSHTFRVRAVDSLGNVDATPASYTWTVDTIGPTALMTSTVTNPTNLSTIPVTITFSEPVCGFIPTSGADLLVTNGAASALTSGSNGSSVYTFNVTPGLQGLVSVSLYNGSVYDGDCVTPLNYNSVDSPSFTITYDSVSPTVTMDQKTGQPDPTNASPINFTVIFSQAVSDFADSDVTLNGTAGATTAVVTGSGTTYNVAVSGMVIDGTVISSIAAGAAHDAAGNPSTASTSSDNTVTYIAGPLSVTVNQAAGQIDPTNSLPVNFTAVFDRPIDASTFTPPDVTLGGTAPGTLTAVITEVAPNDGTTFNIGVSGLTGTGTVTALIAANRVQDAATNENNASTSSDNSVTYDPGVPAISGTNLKTTLTPGPTNIAVKFNEAVYDDPLSDVGTDDVTNPNNYFLLEKGPNGVSERTACNVPPQPPSDDVYFSIDHVDYDNATFTATISINGGIALPVGSYELFVCGTTSIVDLAGNAINNGVSDYTYNFRVTAARTSLPATGFAPDRVTILSAQPESRAYSKENMRLEIPALGITKSIVGVPERDGWDVSWLGQQIGYLDGTAYPTWAGNSVLTGHVTDANGQPGPFAALGTLKWGDRVIIHAFGQDYIYEVRSVNRWTYPKDTRMLEKHEELPWVTLITCTGYDEKTDTYLWRTVVRAVQISVVDAK